MLTAVWARVDNAHTTNGRRCHEEEWLDRAMLLSGSGIADAARHGDAAVVCQHGRAWVRIGWRGLASVVAWLAPVAGKTRRGFLRVRVGWHQFCRGSRNCTGAMHWLQALRGVAACSGARLAWGRKHPTQTSRASRHVGPWLALDSDIIFSRAPAAGSAQGLACDCAFHQPRGFSRIRMQKPGT